MSTDATTFACGMAHPWAPDWWRYQPATVVQQPPRCDHCFCQVGPRNQDVPHRRCCKCMTLMADQFVEAWFRILQPEGEDQ